MKFRTRVQNFILRRETPYRGTKSYPRVENETSYMC
jgi:hypothetical protein